MIIGIDGYAGAGKDTVADIFTKIGFTKVAFADALRRAASINFDIDINMFIDRELKDRDFEAPLVLSPSALCNFCEYLGFPEKCDEVVLKFKYTEIHSPRHLLQFVGTEIGREILSPTIWIDMYCKNIQGLGNVITPDARFSNERELVKGMEGLVFWIDREGLEQTENHKSGTDKWPIDKYDLVVYNNSTIHNIQEELSLWWSLVGHKK